MTDRERRASRRSRSPRFVLSTLAVAVVGAVAGCTPPGLPAPIAPATSSVQGSIPAAERRVTIGVDGAVLGFNPHAIADYSLADAAVAQLVLPSVSRVTSDGSVVLNADVVQKAEVTSHQPFTVTYTLDRNASWSDGTPITAEDFSYLRSAMLVEPGTVDPAGYRLITSIASKDAGKTVQVIFARPLADWQSLFSPLLPSHILKDSPGGWAEGLATGIPVSGNRYKMQGYDAVTGEITLVRNDKYWGKQPGPSVAVLRIGTAAALTQALGRGDLQAVLLQPDAADQRKLDQVAPASNRVSVPLPGTIQLIFNTVRGTTSDTVRGSTSDTVRGTTSDTVQGTTSDTVRGTTSDTVRGTTSDTVQGTTSGTVQGSTSDLRVRRAIAAGLDVSALRAVLDGGNSDGGAAVTSLVSLPPAAPGKSPSSANTTSGPSQTVSPTPAPGGSHPAAGSTTQPETTRAAVATAELEAAGYRRESLYMHKDGQILRLTLAYPADDPRVASAARLVQLQLAAAGIEVELVRDQTRAVVNDRVALGSVDLALVTVPRGPSDGISVASAFGCPLPSAGTPPTSKPPAPRAGNLSGFCSSNVQTVIDQAEASPVPGNLDGLLQQALPVIPISRPAAVFATTPAAAALLRDSGPGWSYSSPLAGLPEWPYR